MNSQQIETFLTIVETGNIVHAAQALYLSQPTVSYRLKSLESELGFDLIARNKGQRNVELTQKGQLFVPIAQKMMHLWQDIRLLSASEALLPISISCPGSVNRHLLTSFSKYIAKENRIFDITIVKANTEEVYQKVSEGSSDIGFVYEKRNIENILSESVYSEKLVLARICNDSTEIRAAYHPAELRLEDELYFNSGPTFKDWHDQWFDKKAHPYVNIAHDRLLANLFDDSRYWSVLPVSLANYLMTVPGMKIYELLYPPKERECYRITKKDLSEDKRRNIQMFIECFRQYLYNEHKELNF